MSKHVTKPKSTPGANTAIAVEMMMSWGIPTGAGLVLVVAAALTAFDAVPSGSGLAITVLGALALVAHLTLTSATRAESARLTMFAAVALVWVAVCYAPFHALLFPGAPLHAPVIVHANDPTLPVTIEAAGHRQIDLLLEGELPPAPGSSTAIPVTYAVTLVGADDLPQTIHGRLDETLGTRRSGRRGTTTVVSLHHADRQAVGNPARGDLRVTSVLLEPATGAGLTLTAHAHRLPPAIVLAVLAVALLIGVLLVDIRLVPQSEGAFMLATAAAVGTAIALWTSNTVHPTFANLVGATLFGGPIGLAAGALAWAIARRTLVHDHR